MDQPPIPYVEAATPMPPPVPASPKPGYELTDTMLAALYASGPWLRFMSILGFIAAGVMVLASLAMLAVGMFGAALSETFGSPAAFAGFATVYLLLSMVYFFLSLHLFRAASGVVESKRGHVRSGVEKALSSQRAFWRLVGILMIVILCLYAAIMLVAVLMAVFGRF
jgi:hypothetical protein